MCEYCEKRTKTIVHSEVTNGSYLDVIIIPSVSPYIHIQYAKPIDIGNKTSFSDKFYIKYCPMCGRNLNEST